MTHPIVKIDDYLFTIGENYKSDIFPYLVIEKLTTGEYHVWQVDNPNDWDEKNQYQILAHLPLNGAKYLDGISVLPPIKKMRELSYEERIRWFVDNYYETGMEYEICLQTMKDFNLDNFKHYDEVVKIPKIS
jgi:hypothetical protein